MLRLVSLALDLQKAEKVASEYGYPGIYHPDRREEADQTGIGSTHYVHVPGIEDQTGIFGVADGIKNAMPDVPDLPKSPFDIPLWAKVALGVTAVGVVLGPFISSALQRRST